VYTGELLYVAGSEAVAAVQHRSVVAVIVESVDENNALLAM
jgi:hypothetical protein